VDAATTHTQLHERGIDIVRARMGPVLVMPL
jgi:hypothetical protein